MLVLLWLGSLPLPCPEQAPQCAGLSPRVCAAVGAPAGASWITRAGHVPTDFPAPCGSHFSCSSVRSAWILIYHTTMVFFLWLDWHYFLRAWSLNVFHSFIFGKFFFVLQRECNQIYYLILSGTYIFLTMLFSISFEAHWLRTGYCLLPVSQSLGQHEGSALCVWSCVWGGSKLSFLSLAWKEGGLGQHAQKLTSGPIWLTYVLYFLVTPSWLPVFVIILTRVQCFWYFTSSEDFLRKVFLYLNLTWKGL